MQPSPSFDAIAEMAHQDDGLGQLKPQDTQLESEYLRTAVQRLTAGHEPPASELSTSQFDDSLSAEENFTTQNYVPTNSQFQDSGVTDSLVQTGVYPTFPATVPSDDFYSGQQQPGVSVAVAYLPFGKEVFPDLGFAFGNVPSPTDMGSWPSMQANQIAVPPQYLSSLPLSTMNYQVPTHPFTHTCGFWPLGDPSMLDFNFFNTDTHANAPLQGLPIQPRISVPAPFAVDGIQVTSTLLRTRVMEFRCTHQSCGRTFSRNSDRARHLKTAHGNGTRFFCHVQNCEKSASGAGWRGYSRADKLTEHLWKKHGDLGFLKGR